MKKLLTLFFIVSFLSFGTDIPDDKNMVKSTQMKKEIEMLKNQIVELKSELDKIQKKDKDIIFDKDRVYSDSLEYYKNARNDAQNSIDHFISSLQWVVGMIITMLAGMIGFLQFRNEKQLTRERKEMQLEDTRLKKEIRAENRKIKKQLEKDKKELEDKILTTKNEITHLIEKHEKDIQKIKIKIKKDVEIVEFSSGLTTALNKVKPEEKIEELKKLNELSTNFTKLQKAKIYFEIAYEYVRLKQYEEAILNYNKAIELEPNDKVAYNNRGNIKANLKQYPSAILDYNQAIKLDPNYRDAYYNRGSIKCELGDNDSAISDYNQVINLNPNDKKAYNNRAITKADLKQYAPAISDYNQAIKLDPNYKNAYNNRGEAQLFLKEYKQALTDLIKCIELDKDYIFMIDIYQENYNGFKIHLEKIKDKNELEQEVYRRLVAKEGFTIIEK